MNLLLIRHGANESLGKYLPGRKPGIHLNLEGKTQAEMIAESLKDLRIDAIFSSPLERAMETAQPLGEILDLRVTPAPGLIEMETGTFTGIPFDKLKSMPEWIELKKSLTESGFPGGESFREAKDRVRQTLDDLKNNFAENAMVAVFSHADIIKMIISESLLMPFSKFTFFTVDPASVSVIMFFKGTNWLNGMNIPLPYHLPLTNQFL